MIPGNVAAPGKKRSESNDPERDGQRYNRLASLRGDPHTARLAGVQWDLLTVQIGGFHVS